MSSISDNGDLPVRDDMFTNCAVEDLRDGDDREGVTLLPTPCSEFIDAFLRRVGVDARASRLIEEELRRSGLLDGALPPGEETAGARWPSREGELTCGEEGRDEDVLIESRWTECDRLELGLFLLLIPGDAGGMDRRWPLGVVAISAMKL